MKFLMLTLLISSSAFATCENEELTIQVNVSEKTFNEAYESESAIFSADDHIHVTLKETKEVFVLSEGVFYADGAGNFSANAQHLMIASAELDHDHEVWHTSGLWGSFETQEKSYDLSSIICEYTDLFNVY